MKLSFKSLAVCLWSAALAASPVFAVDNNFSADMVTQMEGRTMQVKTYVSGDKIRTEMAGAIQITRLDRNVMYVMMPAEKMYMEQPIDPQAFTQAGRDVPGELSRTVVGPDTVEGRPTTQYLVTYEANHSRQSMHQWLDDSGRIAKVASVDGRWSTTYRNLKEGPQPASLFEVPSDYQKMEMPTMPGMGGGFNFQDLQDMEE